MKNIITWFIVILWFLIIFLSSSMTATESGTKSRYLFEKTIYITSKVSKNMANSVTNIGHSRFRKMLHVMVYYILCLLIMMAVKSKHNYFKYIISFILCLIYASIDEYHQLFIDGRCGNIIDVLIDSLGVIIGLFSYYIYKCLLRY